MFDGNSCGVLSAIHEQSEDINRGVDREDEEQGAVLLLLGLFPESGKTKPW